MGSDLFSVGASKIKRISLASEESEEYIGVAISLDFFLS
jgi:hypothetical protein